MSAGMPIVIVMSKKVNTSSTLKAVLAEVSRKIRLFSLAKRSPSSVET